MALWGTRYLSISRGLGRFLLDCATNRLPNVSFVEPRFLGAASGVSNDDHPFADVRDGQVFLNFVYSAVTRSRAWRRTVLVVI